MTVGKHILNKQGFHLRAFNITDSEALFELLNHPEISPYVPIEILPKNVFDSIRHIQKRKQLYSRNEGAYWAICDPHGSLIGTAGFDSWSSINNRYEIAFELHPRFQGQGLMTLSLKYITEFGLKTLKATRIQALTLTHNHPSMRVLTRVGFQKEGVLRKYRMFNGKPTDIAMFSITQNDIQQ
ncbi:GNAT family N-acetyltransferase [Candidatus Comchoanobacter bicostacola]|uniref:GNAT family N-acetyltransferase n=1 Tax=Candidatus Comchoanobacter bicostacola TaxID=2919598 RepID=A0ABY5DK94_9GAMM|nr:GNAT family N-acetyltransferase [Candidatus Comchoanobacter bicostacola]UTC24900.1 GNAT family N-acetyltransferase [Candidatus Comchoanobacter bicostacola]